MTREHHLHLPFSPEQALELNCGDTVYLSGVIHTMRDMGHRRAVEMLACGEALPFDLHDGIIWHCGPIVRKHIPPSAEAAFVRDPAPVASSVPGSPVRWEVLSAGPTTSSRFNELGPELMKRLHVRCTIGKGTMGAKAIPTIREIGGCFLNATGGCGALYASQIEEVIDVFWTDLGLPEAVWVLRVKELGPLIVGIDPQGQAFVRQNWRTNAHKFAGGHRRTAIRPGYDLAYLPKRVVGKRSGEK